MVSSEILDKYADVLVKFALNSGKGISKGDTVLLRVSESAKPMLISLYKSVLSAGGHPLVVYVPDNMGRLIFENGSVDQITYFHGEYYKGLVSQADHLVSIISDVNKKELFGIDSSLIMSRQSAFKQYRKWIEEKENKGAFTWTLALYGTLEMANEVGLSLDEYWNEIIKACFLDSDDPVSKWKEVYFELNRLKTILNGMDIDKLRIESEDTDLFIGLDNNRKWLGCSGRNIPSFELFISPDKRRTSGKIKFNQPLYRYGNLIKDVYLEFEEGRVVKSEASEGLDILRSMIEMEGADFVGEFSLTDKRFSRITKFMGETLFDENVGGEFGNTHIALGNAYKDSYPGEVSEVSDKEWDEMGYNESVVHTDIVSTYNRKVTAYLNNGEDKVIYENGEFKI